MNVYKEGERPQRCTARSLVAFLEQCRPSDKIRIKVDRAPSVSILALCAKKGIPIFFSRKATLNGYTKHDQIPIPYSYFVPGGRVLLDNSIFKTRGFPDLLEAGLDDFLIVLDVMLRGLGDKVYFGYLDGNFTSRQESPFIARQGLVTSPIYQDTCANGTVYSVIANGKFKGNFFQIKNEERVQYISDGEYRGEPGELTVLFPTPVHLSGEEFFHLIKQTETKRVSHNMFALGSKKQLVAKVNFSISLFPGCHRFIKAGSSFGIKMFV